MTHTLGVESGSTVHTKRISVPAVHSSLVPSLSLPINIVHITNLIYLKLSGL